MRSTNTFWTNRIPVRRSYWGFGEGSLIMLVIQQSESSRTGLVRKVGNALSRIQAVNPPLRMICLGIAWF